MKCPKQAKSHTDGNRSLSVYPGLERVRVRRLNYGNRFVFQVGKLVVMFDIFMYVLKISELYGSNEWTV